MNFKHKFNKILQKSFKKMTIHSNEHCQLEEKSQTAGVFASFSLENKIVLLYIIWIIFIYT